MALAQTMPDGVGTRYVRAVARAAYRPTARIVNIC